MLLRRARLPPQDMSAVPPRPRPEMKLLLCDCWSWWSRWGWDGRLYFWTAPPAVPSLTPTGPGPSTAVACKPESDNKEARGCGWAVLGHWRGQWKEKRHNYGMSMMGRKCEDSDRGDTPSLTRQCWKHHKVAFKRNLDLWTLLSQTDCSY